jgi:hypothetical protein
MTATYAVAGHAVAPICSRCGRPVRSSVEIAAEVADARESAAALPAEALGALFEHLRAELCGEHLDCAEPLRLGQLEDLFALTH